MAKSTSQNFISLYTTLLATLLFLLTLVSATSDGHFSRPLSRAKHGLKKEKLSHLHFYFHDIVSGRSPTAIRISEAPTTRNFSTAFGIMVMMDDPLTAGPELGSKLVGKAQGIYASASQTELGFLMVLNFVFCEGKYNGSYVSVVGRNTPFSDVREMPIVGGSGLFRFARGYSHAKTRKVDFNTGDAVVEYNVYVLHY